MQKTALITGAARGNGLAIARALLESGVYVCVADLPTALPVIPYPLSGAAELERAEAELRALSPHVHVLRCDIRSGGAVERMVTEIEALRGRIDILVNNAGVLALHPIEEVSDAEWDAQMDVIAKGAFLCTRRVLPGMNARRWGRVINVASVAGHRGIGLGVAYTAAKHALVGFTRALAMEVAAQHITVNAVCPGTVPTALVEGTGRALGLEAEETLARFSHRHLTGRPIEPEAVAEAVRWLASDAAARVNGSSLFVDDGWHIH